MRVGMQRAGPYRACEAGTGGLGVPESYPKSADRMDMDGATKDRSVRR